MSSLLIDGGKPLHGSVRIGGAKNASFKLMIASLLGSQESRLLNFSQISDVELVAKIISYLGAKVTRAGDRAIFIDPQDLSAFTIQAEHGEQGRFSTMFIPPLLAKFGQAIVPMPGGDKIGARPLDRHFAGLEAMGVTIEFSQNQCLARCQQLVGTHYHFTKNTHTGTETLIMAAVLAKGKTVLENAALEPEIDDLIDFLNQMGAKIKRLPNKIIEIEGVEKLGGATHKLLPDRNEAVSYACAALATKGDVIIENARAQELTAFLDKLEEVGAGFEVGDYGLRFYYHQPLKAVQVETKPHPGFMSDWQPLWATLMTQAEGESIVHETIMANRFQYVPDLVAMGAKIELFQPQVKNPASYYNFDAQPGEKEPPHAIKIFGPTRLKAGNFQVKDLRHGATLVTAALAATDRSQIDGVELIDRGYEALAERLQSMGAQITRK